MIGDTRNMEGDNCEALIWSHLGLDLKKKLKTHQCYNFPIPSSWKKNKDNKNK